MQKTIIFFPGSHPALSAAEIFAYSERTGVNISWNLSRFPVALFVSGVLPSPPEVQPMLGGTTMIGTLHATVLELPTPAELLSLLPELKVGKRGKRLIGISALSFSLQQSLGLTQEVRRIGIDLKRAIGMKGTRVVLPPARRPDLSTAQLLHNRLPREGTALFLLIAPSQVDIVTIDTIQDIEAYTQRDRGRPHADPGRGMLPPKVAQMLLNVSLIPPGGTVYDPFCGVGTIPMEAALMGLRVIASDVSPKQVQRTLENLEWLRRHHAPSPMALGPVRVFVHNITKGAVPLEPNSVDAIVTEGWLGPARTRSPLPREADKVFNVVIELLTNLLHRTARVLRPGGRVLVTVPAFRVRKRILHFSLGSVNVSGFEQELLVPQDLDHPLFREAQARGTLLYGRPDAIVLRELVRFRRVQ
ncbi:MAG: hypothetical protein G01um101438_142 [Parcubacteria group bacterium Gr01-1014_38]|nr:MAG: hypothetical protein G01um101438_142 [Parcubacteria group bacterium Gr01-1014_38]